MGSRTVVLSAIGGCAVGFSAAWLLFGSDGARKVEEQASSQVLQRLAEEARPSQAAPNLERPESRVPISTEVERQPEVSVPRTSKAQKFIEEAVLRDQFNRFLKTPVEVPSPDSTGLPETTRAEIASKLYALNAQIDREAQPIFAQRFQDGLSSHWSDDPVCPHVDSEADRATICAFQPATNGEGWDRAVLPQWQYPELYALKGEALRLEQLLRGTKQAAASR